MSRTLGSLPGAICCSPCLCSRALPVKGINKIFKENHCFLSHLVKAGVCDPEDGPQGLGHLEAEVCPQPRSCPESTSPHPQMVGTVIRGGRQAAPAQCALGGGQRRKAPAKSQPCWDRSRALGERRRPRRPLSMLMSVSGCLSPTAPATGAWCLGATSGRGSEGRRRPRACVCHVSAPAAGAWAAPCVSESPGVLDGALPSTEEARAAVPAGTGPPAGLQLSADVAFYPTFFQGKLPFR